MSDIEKDSKIVCPGCGGSGQVSFFKGVSRFLISSEECPECSGLGYLFDGPAKQRSEPGRPKE